MFTSRARAGLCIAIPVLARTLLRRALASILRRSPLHFLHATSHVPAVLLVELLDCPKPTRLLLNFRPEDATQHALAVSSGNALVSAPATGATFARFVYRTCDKVWGMSALPDQGACAHCGGAIPGRLDPRGRRARYCCGACRAAASRARAAASAAVAPVGEDRVVAAVEALADIAEERALEPAELHHARRIVDAAARISEAHRARLSNRAEIAVSKAPASTPDSGLSRQQRRSQARAVRKIGGSAK